ncbi:polysaccharide biosynthesis/export family protein [uncultured Hoeflea sp.]|uniref:polysaccharide biosynthesis/export family protein n=1 Tax=uncultured Hoeflea sp. TaxID=538666 RepID=UPI0030DB852B
MSILKNAVRVLAVCVLPFTASACNNLGISHAPAAANSDLTSGTLRLVEMLPAPTNSAGGQEQPLMAGDVLAIEVFQADQLNRTVQIDSTGRVSLPLIGTLTAGGKTLRGLEQEIKDLYQARYLQKPEVSVFLKESVGQRVTVDGEVAEAGLFPVTYNTTLLDAIALAGGLRDLADQKKVYVYRTVGGDKYLANFNVASIRNGRSPNPRIYGGDVVVVFTSQSRVAINNLKEALGVSSRLATGLAVIP